MTTGLIGKTFRQLDDPMIRRVMWFSIAIAALVFALIWLGLSYLLDGQIATGYGWLDGVLNGLAQLLGAAAVLVLAWLLYPGLVGMFAGIFLEDVAAAVERRHYPDLPAARVQSVGEIIVIGLRFALVSVAVNLVALPVYLFVPAVNFLVFVLVNGWLLGRNFYEIVALRRLDPPTAKSVRRAGRLRVMAAGMATALMMAVPILNLIAPILATVLMVHVFQAMARPREIAGLDDKTLVFPNKIG